MERDTNTLGWSEYLVAHLYWGWLAYHFFSNRLFLRIYSPMSGELLSTDTCQRVLLILVIVCSILGMAFSAIRRRNYRTLFLNVCTPYGIYLILETVPDIPPYIVGTLFAWAVLAISYAVVLIVAPIRNRRNIPTIICKRLQQFFMNTQVTFYGLLSVFTIIAVAGVLLGIPIVEAQREWQPSEGTPRLPIAFEELKEDLTEENWTYLSIQDKVNRMQLVANIEASYLGIPEGLVVCCESLSPYVMGGYVHEESIIQISKDHLLYDSGEACVQTVLHEAYHSFQHHLCAVYDQLDDNYKELYLLRDAAIYEHEFADYQNGNNGFWEYYNQLCEADARRYAEDRLILYLGGVN